MAKYLTFAAFGWLTFTGTLHFAIDVVSQYVRGKRAPGPETTLYYGLNSAFALGQVLFGLMCLWAARRHPDLLRDPGVALLAGAGAAACWHSLLRQCDVGSRSSTWASLPHCWSSPS